MPKLAIGKKVPDFALESSSGPWRLKSNLGSRLVLYFYPKDNTSGCTSEGEAFRDLGAQFKKAKTVILGVSPDSVASHIKFREKYKFPFDLLADPDKEAAMLFEVYKEKSMYGRKYMGVERSTFLLDQYNVLRAEWRKVKVGGHADEVLAAARSL